MATEDKAAKAIELARIGLRLVMEVVDAFRRGDVTEEQAEERLKALVDGFAAREAEVLRWLGTKKPTT